MKEKYQFLRNENSIFISIILILFGIGLLGMTSLSLAQGDIWTEKTPMPTARCALGAVVVDGKNYAIGGLRTETVALNVVEVYDPVTDSWDTTKTPMPTARGSFGCTVVDGKIYAIGGGIVGSYNLSIVEVYDPVTDSWDKTKKPMHTPRSEVAACMVNGKIYVIGGTKEVSGILAGTSIVEEYDPATDIWTRKTDKPTPGWGLRACALEGKIYVTGGNVKYPDISAALEVYDPVTDKWDTTKTPMPEVKYSHSMSVSNGKIYVFGGWYTCAFGPMYKDVDEYDPLTNSWDTTKTPMPKKIGELSTVALDGKIYIIGGTSTQHPFTSIDNVYEYDPLSDDPTSVENLALDQNPREFVLHQNYPNPFNPDTRIGYEVSKPTCVVLRVMNLLGQDVCTLVNEDKPVGCYEVKWDGKNDLGQRVSSGVYLYRLESKDFIQTRKMILLQ